MGTRFLNGIDDVWSFNAFEIFQFFDQGFVTPLGHGDSIHNIFRLYLGPFGCILMKLKGKLNIQIPEPQIAQGCIKYYVLGGVMVDPHKIKNILKKGLIKGYLENRTAGA
jgi:hypothetical protein